MFFSVRHIIIVIMHQLLLSYIHIYIYYDLYTHHNLLVFNMSFYQLFLTFFNVILFEFYSISLEYLKRYKYYLSI